MFSDINAVDEVLNANLQKRLFGMLVLTGCIANLLGFLSNLVLFGLSLPTLFCGACEIVMVVCGVVGIAKGKPKNAAAVMVLVLALLEFPFLFYVHGASMGVYLVLGILALAVYFPRPYHLPAILVTILLDVLVILLSYFFPATVESMKQHSSLGTMLCSYLIVAAAVAVILCDLIKQYRRQRKYIIQVSQKLEYAAQRDALTGVYNRRYLIDTIRQWMKEEDKSFLAALIDVDDFKIINDTYGHVYGDEVLTELARLMKQEIHGKGIAARYGGEEFMLLFEGTDRQMALETLRRINTGLGEFSMRTRGITITFSGGLEEYRADTKVDELFRNADRKLYQAKRNGKNQVIG